MLKPRTLLKISFNTFGWVKITPKSVAIFIGGCWTIGAFGPVSAQSAVCQAQSGPAVVPVIELFTSEGCSSCPPSDQWLSTLKGKPVVAQAFHVAYWDYIGWVDRFASPAHTTRQRAIAAQNGLGNIYTPQLVRNGKDWRQLSFSGYDRALIDSGPQPAAKAQLMLQATSPNAFVATVTPSDPKLAWTAYWTVTEHGHTSKVKAGENAGETLKHDFVVRQYTPAGQYKGEQKLQFASIAADPAYPRQINLVVQDAATGKPLQALALSCKA